MERCKGSMELSNSRARRVNKTEDSWFRDGYLISMKPYPKELLEWLWGRVLPLHRDTFRCGCSFLRSLLRFGNLFGRLALTGLRLWWIAALEEFAGFILMSWTTHRKLRKEMRGLRKMKELSSSGRRSYYLNISNFASRVQARDPALACDVPLAYSIPLAYKSHWHTIPLVCSRVIRNK